MLRDFEKLAVQSLVIRQLEAQDLQAETEKEIARLQAIVTETKSVRTSILTALKVFGFDTTEKNYWDDVKRELGKDLWRDAFAIARPKLLSNTKDDHVDFKNTFDSQPEAQALDAVNIRDQVIEELKLAGESGIKTSEIRQNFMDRGIEMHEKTVGMTLYRLSKENIARREGRIWFFVPDAEREESSEDESGPDASEDSGGDT